MRIYRQAVAKFYNGYLSNRDDSYNLRAGDAMPIRPREGPEPSRSRAAVIAVVVGALGLFFAAAIRLMTRRNWRPRESAPATTGAGSAGSVFQPGPGRHAATEETPHRDDSPGLLFGCGALAFALVCGGLAIYGYDHLSQSYPPATLTIAATASTRSPSILQDLRLADASNGAKVRWQVEPGYVSQLTVTGPNSLGVAEVILPLPQTKCAAVARRLDASCIRGREVSVTSPATFTWSNPQVVGSTNGSQVVSTSLDIMPSIVKPGVAQVDVSTDTNERPSLCFSWPLSAANLTVRSGPGVLTSTFTGSGLPVGCATGLPILIGLSGKGLPPMFEFGGISTLWLQAWAPSGTLSGYAGKLELSPGGTTVLGVPEAVSLCSAKAACQSSISTSFQIAQAGQSQSLSLKSDGATSVITNDGQLVPSRWSRRTEIYGPILGGVITVAVVGPLGIFVQAFMNALRRLPGRSKRRKRTARLDKEPHHAP